MSSEEDAAAGLVQPGAEEPDEKRKVKKVIRKRKKKHLSLCERTCIICRDPCDNPFNPEDVKSGRRG